MKKKQIYGVMALMALIVTNLIVFNKFVFANIIRRSSVSVERNVDTANIENKTVNVKYKITPEPIKSSSVSNNKDQKDIVLVFDTSESMNKDINGNQTYVDNHRKISIMKKTSIDFINNVDKNDPQIKIGLVQYSSEVQKVKHVSNTHIKNLEKEINSMSAKGGTNLGGGLSEAYNMLNNGNSKDKYIVLMSDGLEGNEKALQYAKEMAGVISNSNKGIKTIVIGFGNETDSDKLQQIADSAGGKYYEGIDENAIKSVYESIGEVIEANISAAVHFEEAINDDVEIINSEQLPYGFNLQREENGDRKLVGDINNIYYILSDDGKYYVAEPIEFTVTYRLSDRHSILGENNTSFMEYMTTIGQTERIAFEPLELDVIDNSELSITKTTISSNNSYNKSFAKVGDVITISIEASKEVNEPVVTVGGKVAEKIVMVGSSEKEWKASYTMKESDNEGKVAFTIQLKDKYLDNTITIGDTTDESHVIFDKTLPKVKVEYSTTEPTNKNVVATLVGLQENGERFIVTNNNSKEKYTFTENKTFNFNYRDETGNSGVLAAKVDWIDKTPPAGYSVDIYEVTPNQVNKSNFVFTIKAAEVNTTYNYTIMSSGGSKRITGTGKVTEANSSKTTTDFQISGLNISELQDGSITVVATLMDSAGNVGVEKSDTVNLNIEDILRQGIYINKGIIELSAVNIIKNLPVDLGASFEISSSVPTITVSFDKNVKSATFKLVDTKGRLVASTLTKNGNNQYTIKSTQPIDGEYIVLYRVIASKANESINITVDFNGIAEDTMKANVINLPRLD